MLYKRNKYFLFMQIFTYVYNLTKAFFAISMMSFSILSTSLCSEEDENLNNSNLLNPEVPKIELKKSKIEEGNDISENTNKLKKHNSDDKNIDASNEKRIAISENKINEHKSSEEKNSSEDKEILKGEQNKKILETIFKIFANLGEFNNSKNKVFYINKYFEKKFKKLCEMQSEGELKSAVKEFYDIYIEGCKIYYGYAFSDFINIFIYMFRLCSSYYKDSDQITDKSKTFQNIFAELFISSCHYYTKDIQGKSSILNNICFYNIYAIPVFKPEGIILYQQQWTYKDGKYKKNKIENDQIYKVDLFSKYLIFDAKENLTFFFEYFKNDDFTVDFYGKTYELIGFVLDNKNYEYFMIYDNFVMLDGNGANEKIHWSEFKQKFGDIYGNENVIVILKKN